MNNYGYTIVFIPWEDMEGKPVVYDRCLSYEEKEELLKEARESLDSIELQTLTVINDYNYSLTR